MFYLLKSTFMREQSCDVIINKNEIESIVLVKLIKDNSDPTDQSCYQLKFTMKSKDYWVQNFNTESEARKELNNFVSEDICNNILVKIVDPNERKKEEFEKMSKLFESMQP